MLETIDRWIIAITNWMAIIPVKGWAVIAGVFIGMVVTQWLKRTFPIHIICPNMSPAMHKMWIRIAALVFAAAPTYYIWPGSNAIWAAIAVGFGTPSVYRIGTFFVYNKWPHLRERFSGTENGT